MRTGMSVSLQRRAACRTRGRAAVCRCRDFHSAKFRPREKSGKRELRAAIETRADPSQDERVSARRVRFAEPERIEIPDVSSAESTDYSSVEEEAPTNVLEGCSVAEIFIPSRDRAIGTRAGNRGLREGEGISRDAEYAAGQIRELRRFACEIDDETCAIDDGRRRVVLRMRRRRNRGEEPTRDDDGRPYLDICVFGRNYRALVDTGASRSYFGGRATDILRPYIDKGHVRYMRTADGRESETLGEIPLEIDVQGIRKCLNFRVTPALDYECILGIDFLRLFAITIDSARNQLQMSDGSRFQFADRTTGETHSSADECHAIAELNEMQAERLAAFLREKIPVSSGRTPVTSLVKHRIDVQGSAPIRQAARRVSPVILKVAHAEVDRMLEEGIIEPSTSAWASCPVIVSKPDGKYRFCVDYRRVNEVTRKDAYPIPHIDSILDKLRIAKYITTLDLSQAYFQIPLEDASKEITAFIVPGKGLFQFRRMPFGLTNAPATFQRLMDRLIPPEFDPRVFVYLDDVIIVTETFEEHLEWLERVLGVLTRAGFEINREKSKFCRADVRFLGYRVSSQGLAPDPEKVRPVLDYPAPTNLKTLRRFLGMVGWYARFLPEHARDKVPLVKLLRKGERWYWGDEQNSAFLRLKSALCSAPVLARPDFSRPFQVQTDASDYAIAAALTQVTDGEEHPIAYVNRLLTSAERNYTTTEKECLAVVWAIKKWRAYLEGYHFTVITDHSSLRWLHNLKDPVGRLGRWALGLQQYSFDVVHRKGALHKVPDALSRSLLGVNEDNQVAASQDSEAPEAQSSPKIAGQDPWYNARVEKVRKNPSAFPDWKIEDNQLYCHRPQAIYETLGEDFDAWKLVLPRKLRRRALTEAHADTSAGHAGVEKTYSRVNRLYYWPGIFKDVVAYVRTCETCQRHKVAQRAPAGLMTSRVVERPWTVVAADVMGPFPPSRNQFRYVVVFLDNFSKWIECRALRKADAKSIVKAFEDLVVYRWGAPDIFLCDNGTEFVNQEVAKCLREHGIRQFTIPPYHAQANPVERVNRVLKTMISIFVGSDHRDWDAHLTEFRFAVNTAMHSSAGLSPAFINLGRDPSLARRLRREIDGPRLVLRQDLGNWVARVKRLPLIYDIVQTELEKASARQARYYNRGRREVRYRVGDLVWRKNRTLSSAAQNFAAKLAPTYDGPYTIARVLSPVVYELDVSQTGRSNPKVHVSDLKPFVATLETTVADEEESGEAARVESDPEPSLSPSSGRARRDGKRSSSGGGNGDSATALPTTWERRLRPRTSSA